MLEREELEKPSLSLFRVNVLFDDGSSRESTFYFDYKDADDEVKLLLSEIFQTFGLPKTFLPKVTYRGVQENSIPDHDEGIEMKFSRDISSLNLDTRYTHVFYVQELKWNITVQVDVPGKIINHEFSTN